jgi:hypothetical protein
MKLVLILMQIPLLLNACARNGFLMAKVNLYGDSYPSKADDAKIDIYRTKAPSKNYKEIAEITCADTNDEWALDQIVKKAREIGADGIFIVGDAGAYGVGVPVGSSVVYTSAESYGIQAIAIKYIEH